MGWEEQELTHKVTLCSYCSLPRDAKQARICEHYSLRNESLPQTGRGRMEVTPRGPTHLLGRLYSICLQGKSDGNTVTSHSLKASSEIPAWVLLSHLGAHEIIIFTH